MQVTYKTVLTDIDDAISDAMMSNRHIYYITLTGREWAELNVVTNGDIHKAPDGCICPKYRGVILK
jgi:hypothetical protein